MDDPRNNSAWNQRWFATHEGQIAAALTAGESAQSVLSLDLAEEEAHYGICGAKLDPYNESPWRYLIGVLMEQWRFAQKDGTDGELFMFDLSLN